MVNPAGRLPYRGTDNRVRFSAWDIPATLPTFPVWDITERNQYPNETLDINAIHGEGYLVEEDGEWYEVRETQTRKSWVNLKTGVETVAWNRSGRYDQRRGSRQQRPSYYPHFWTMPDEEPMTGHMGYVYFGEEPKAKPPKPPRPHRPKGKPTEQEARDQAKADKDRLRKMRPSSSTPKPQQTSSSPAEDGPPVTKTTRVMFKNSKGEWQDLPHLTEDGFSL